MATASSDSAEQSHEIELPPVPEYDTSEMAALDEALVEAMERAHAADEATLAHVLRCEVGTVRYKDALGE
jgi:hypothetical protein